MVAPALDREREVARSLVIDAARVVLEHYHEGVQVDWKGRDDPVTAADRGANGLIVERLAATFPGDAILSEESRDDLSRLDAERVWIVDPLDGTKDFLCRNGEFAIMVGLAVRGEPAVGAVCQPAGMVVWHAARGRGAVRETQAGGARSVRVSSVSDPASMRLVVTRSHRYPEIDEVVRTLGIRAEKPLGSVGLKVGAIVDGDADLYVHLAPGIKEWDTCAPALILEEAGGAITDAFGAALGYNGRDVHRRSGVVASNAAAHRRLIEILAPIAERALTA